MISLVICTYNPDPKLLKRAVESAKGFDEVIIVDDGSKNPVEGATITMQENYGLATARNIGITYAKGDIIALLDDDDYFGDLTEMFKFVKENDSDIYHFTIQCSDGSKWGADNVGTIEQEDCIPGTSWFKKSVWEDTKGYVDLVAEDWIFWCKAKKLGKKFTYVPHIFYNYTIRPESLSHKNAGRLDEARKYINENCINY